MMIALMMMMMTIMARRRSRNRGRGVAGAPPSDGLDFVRAAGENAPALIGPRLRLEIPGARRPSR